MFFAFLMDGNISGFFHSDENAPFVKHDLNMISQGLHNEMPQSLITRTLSFSGPWDLLGSKRWIILKMPSWENVIDERNSSDRVTKLVKSLLLFCIIEHCWAKTQLKNSAFFLKLVTKLSLWYSRRMIGKFLSFKKLK